MGLFSNTGPYETGNPDPVQHSGPPWLGFGGQLGGSLLGGFFGGPVGSQIGGKVGRPAGMGIGDLFSGNWGGLLADADPNGMLGGITGGGNGSNNLFDPKALLGEALGGPGGGTGGGANLGSPMMLMGGGLPGMGGGMGMNPLSLLGMR